MRGGDLDDEGCALGLLDRPLLARRKRSRQRQALALASGRQRLDRATPAWQFGLALGSLGRTAFAPLIGTPEGVDPVGEPVEPANGQPSKRPGRKYSPEVGKVFANVQGTSATYQLTGKELYVRAVVRSNKPIANALNGSVQQQEAWCQPVGWEKQ